MSLDPQTIESNLSRKINKQGEVSDICYFQFAQVRQSLIKRYVPSLKVANLLRGATGLGSARVHEVKTKNVRRALLRPWKCGN